MTNVISDDRSRSGTRVSVWLSWRVWTRNTISASTGRCAGSCSAIRVTATRGIAASPRGWRYPVTSAVAGTGSRQLVRWRGPGTPARHLPPLLMAEPRDHARQNDGAGCRVLDTSAVNDLGLGVLDFTLSRPRVGKGTGFRLLHFGHVLIETFNAGRCGRSFELHTLFVANLCREATPPSRTVWSQPRLPTYSGNECWTTASDWTHFKFPLRTALSSSQTLSVLHVPGITKRN